MLELLNHSWPWLILGAIFLIWGITSLHLSIHQWVGLFFSIIFNNLSDQTKSEKRKVHNSPLDDAMASNLGCTLIFAGIILLFIGIIRSLN